MGQLGNYGFWLCSNVLPISARNTRVIFPILLHLRGCSSSTVCTRIHIALYPPPTLPLGPPPTPKRQYAHCSQGIIFIAHEDYPLPRKLRREETWIWWANRPFVFFLSLPGENKFIAFSPSDLFSSFLSSLLIKAISVLRSRGSSIIHGRASSSARPLFSFPASLLASPLAL